MRNATLIVVAPCSPKKVFLSMRDSMTTSCMFMRR
jgi:hypothetical protein